MHLTQIDIVTTMYRTIWRTSLFDRLIRGRNQQYYDFGIIFSDGHFVFMNICEKIKQIQKHAKMLIVRLTLTLTHIFTLQGVIKIYVGLSVRNDTKVIQIGHVCTEVDIFITLNISTDTKQGRGTKYQPAPPPLPSHDLSLRFFWCY